MFALESTAVEDVPAVDVGDEADVRLFVLGGYVLYPTRRDMLRVFEPRYRMMLKDYFERGTPFGIISGHSDNNAGVRAGAVGTLAIVDGIQIQNSDGHAAVLLRGTRRFALEFDGVVEPDTFGLVVARVKFFEDDCGPVGSSLREQAVNALEELHRDPGLFRVEQRGESERDSDQGLAFRLAEALAVRYGSASTNQIKWLKTTNAEERFCGLLESAERLREEQSSDDNR